MSPALHIVFLPSAKADIQSAIEWYESRQYEMGKKFKTEVVRAIDSMPDPVKGYAPVYMNLSRVFVKKFPYVIYFKMDTDRNRLVIYAVLHKKQNRENILKKRV
ncbi:type II toxin-antitoxin system RelE/ParE family toxin [Terrimonas alba]|uniref:type II toxin-antitoxin system RelE/ParE family toxin n=1 Tax=Terrimonas alba TaxID=3349636 RepID=UPI0035F4F7A9